MRRWLMLSLAEELKVLEKDLINTPMRISAYHDLPFAIFRYDPRNEYELRKRIRLLGISLEQNHKRKITYISLAKLLWEAIEETEGIDAIIKEESQRGFEKAQTTVHTILEDEEFKPIVNEITKKTKNLNPKIDIVFIVRVAALAPDIYRCAVLLDKMHGKTMVPMIMFYPGTIEGQTDLRFMGMKTRAHQGTYNYRVKIYGGK